MALPGVHSFGDRRVDATGRFMDYDGQPQPGADIATRGMLIGARANPRARDYVRVYGDLPAASLGPAGGG